MSDIVWISTAPAHASNLRPFQNSFWRENSEQEQELCNTTARLKSGEALSSDCFPSEIFGAPNAKENDYNLPDFFYGYGFWVLSQAAADILRQFDLGGGALYPVKVLKKDRITSVGGDWFCINFGNVKSAFLPTESPTAKQRYIRNGEKGWGAPAVLQDNEFAVSSIALSGPDIWIDPLVRDAIFLSEALGKALKKVKADKGFFLKKCRVVAA
jgi:hypothetical protein